ncbi:hypothetical protein Hypma_005325 [Hypsizygus marmoreus]|uniref:Protein kinase domain-containing protein n=1 Tax=Hypsizygus marmoreus TaxID=39966 RepID=A0A369JWY6_HYPMA|nr:hypothetical protein Hypma_005325 [Hypsizygus marmoreus]
MYSSAPIHLCYRRFLITRSGTHPLRNGSFFAGSFSAFFSRSFRCNYVHTSPRNSYPSETSTPHPYSAGSRLDLQFILEAGTGFRPLSVDIVKPFEPFSSAVVLLVKPQSRNEAQAQALGLPSQFIAKITDRRFTDREEEGFPAWSLSYESSFRTTIERALEEKPWIDTVSYLYPDNEDEVAWEEPWVKELELYEARKLAHDMEVAAYQHLYSLQGTDIPRFFGTFRLSAQPPVPHHTHTLAASMFDYLEGMALEYIDSFTMDQVRPDIDIPRKDVQRASKKALQIMKRLRDLHMIHNDSHARNVLIRRDPPHNPMLIDFGLACFKPPLMSVAEWKESIQGIDEIKQMRDSLP